ncbi:MAG TPA: hypothetical protein VFQ36_20965 [Ktedonobacteraceae bacterium]|nr:hypothetical protein [Ktedonobacteraceae bacterium]
MSLQQHTFVSVENNKEARPGEQEDGFAHVHAVADYLHVPDATVEAWIEQQEVEEKSQSRKEADWLPSPSWSSRTRSLAEQVVAGQQVYDTQGERVGKIIVRFPHYLLIERGLIFRRTYYVPLSLVERVEDERVWLAVSEATLTEQGYGRIPEKLYHVPRPPGATMFADISGASLLGKYPPTPAETGHYHYGPPGPGINTDASGSYAPYEIDPYGRLQDRPVRLYITGKEVHGRTL